MLCYARTYAVLCYALLAGGGEARGGGGGGAPAWPWVHAKLNT